MAGLLGGRVGSTRRRSRKCTAEGSAGRGRLSAAGPSQQVGEAVGPPDRRPLAPFGLEAVALVEADGTVVVGDHLQLHPGQSQVAVGEIQQRPQQQAADAAPPPPLVDHHPDLADVARLAAADPQPCGPDHPPPSLGDELVVIRAALLQAGADVGDAVRGQR
jgi:hypothetical protein